MKQPRKAVIFDLYGTLVDVQVDEASPTFWNALADDLTASERNVPGEVLQGAYRRLIQKVSETSGEGFMLDAVFSGLLEEIGLAPTLENLCRFAELFRKHSLTLLSKKSYSDDLVGAIRRSGYRLGLISNTEALLTTYDLKILDLEDKFDAIVLSSMVGVRKPDPSIFAIALERLGVRSGDCAYVGDNFTDDIAGASRAGIDAVFLTALTDSPPAGAFGGGQRVICAGFDLVEIIRALRKMGFVIPFS